MNGRQTSKKVLPMKMKDIDFSGDDYGKHGKKGRTLVSSPKKHYNPLLNCEVKLLNLKDVAEAVADIETDIILKSSVPKAKEECVKEIIKQSDLKPDDISNIDDVFLISSNKRQFIENLQKLMT